MESSDNIWEHRVNEDPTLFTRADALVVVASLAVAGAVAAVRWFGFGRSSQYATDPGDSGGDGSDMAAVSVGSDATDATDQSGAGDAADRPGAGLYAVVQNTEGFYQALPLSQDTQVTVESSLGANTIEVSDGRVCVSQADCANQICVDTGWISAEGQTITCLPHKLIVEVVSDPSQASKLS